MLIIILSFIIWSHNLQRPVFLDFFKNFQLNWFKHWWIGFNAPFTKFHLRRIWFVVFMRSRLTITRTSCDAITWVSLRTVTLFITTPSPDSVITSDEAVSIRHPTRFRWISTSVTEIRTIFGTSRSVTPSSRWAVQDIYFTEVHQMSVNGVICSSNGHVTSPQWSWISVLVVTTDQHQILFSVDYFIAHIAVIRQQHLLRHWLWSTLWSTYYWVGL